jgi:Pyruvate/2-oxoacid:ferredoxin oxidoreductase delta subunit
VDERRCTNCGDCLACCPTACLERLAPAWSRPAGADASVPVVSVPEACVHCGVCAVVCPADAVELVRRDGTVVSLAELALRDL